jgi:hypothetical protein
MRCYQCWRTMRNIAIASLLNEVTSTFHCAMTVGRVFALLAMTGTWPVYCA